ncbi:hypothetical protein S2091_4017 [Solimicrobium silvestre]|uniref:Uncharacterized protein n=1 Tax=Solimicrobium silvestre TaxID=2099400 RepID=A0A2S9GU24_9BURK|nr:hypothetical protein S2091_4017 [Solimicrobium silvestre]
MLQALARCSYKLEHARLYSINLAVTSEQEASL